MSLVALQPITRENWKDCIALRLALDQERWLPSNLYSIAEAQFYPESQARAVYTVNTIMVGFVLFGRDAATGFWKLFRLMIAAEYQQSGYGTAALQAVITEVSALPKADRLLVSYQRDNHVARQLYAHCGFVEQPRTDTHDTAIRWLNQPI
jgi:diamine N-acetyltransferase